jgi:hypothetical protein
MSSPFRELHHHLEVKRLLLIPSIRCVADNSIPPKHNWMVHKFIHPLLSIIIISTLSARCVFHKTTTYKCRPRVNSKRAKYIIPVQSSNYSMQKNKQLRDLKIASPRGDPACLAGNFSSLYHE